MRSARILGSAILLFSVAGSSTMAQTVTSVWPPVLGQTKDRALVRINLSGNFGDNRIIADGLAITISDDLYGRIPGGSRTYEFDTANNGVNIGGAIAIKPPTARIFDAFTTLTNVINADATMPFYAKYQYSSDIGNNGWYLLVWKYDNEYRLTSGANLGPNIVEASDPNGDIAIAGNFSTANPEGIGIGAPVYLQLEGTDLGLLNNTTSVKLRHDVNTTELIDGRVIVKYTTNATVRFLLETGVGSPQVFPSLGQYDLEINGAVVIDKAVTLVENLLDDKTFRVHSSGSPLAVFWNSGEVMVSPYWRTLVPYPDTDGLRIGNVNPPSTPRNYPFQTGPGEANNSGLFDNEYGSLQWSTNDGLHKFYQTIWVNFASPTTLKLTGVWSATGDHYAMSYGAQIRTGDHNGTVIAQTPPGQKVVTPFGWTDFSVTGIVPGGTTQITVVFYGNHSTTSSKSLHLDDLLLYVDNSISTPPAVTGMTTPDFAAVGNTNATITLTGANLTNGQTSVTLRAPDVWIKDRMEWADFGKQLLDLDEDSFGPYAFTPGDKIVLTGGSNVILGEYEIASKGSDQAITLVGDINGPNGDEGESITGYIIKAPLAASTVNATGTQVTATFDLTGAPAGYRNIVVEVGTHDPIVWREGFNVINAGSTLINGSFELPTAPQDCNGVRIENYTPASDWNVRYWNKYFDASTGVPVLNYRDDHWVNPSYDGPPCPPAERGIHYASTAVYNGQGTAQWYQTLETTPGRKYNLSGWFGHSNEFQHGTEITLSLLDGDSAAAPMAGGSAVVLVPGNFEAWTFGEVSGTTTGNLFTVAWEVKIEGGDPGPRVAWIDHLVLEEDICHKPFADADNDGDVDQDDFALFQRCYTGATGPVPIEPVYCTCFDTAKDGDIDAGDFGDFEACASGPAVPVNPNCAN